MIALQVSHRSALLPQVLLAVLLCLQENPQKDRGMNMDMVTVTDLVRGMNTDMVRVMNTDMVRVTDMDVDMVTDMVMGLSKGNIRKSTKRIRSYSTRTYIIQISIMYHKVIQTEVEDRTGPNPKAKPDLKMNIKPIPSVPP